MLRLWRRSIPWIHFPMFSVLLCGIYLPSLHLYVSKPGRVPEEGTRKIIDPWNTSSGEKMEDPRLLCLKKRKQQSDASTVPGRGMETRLCLPRPWARMQQGDAGDLQAGGWRQEPAAEGCCACLPHGAWPGRWAPVRAAATERTQPWGTRCLLPSAAVLLPTACWDRLKMEPREPPSRKNLSPNLSPRLKLHKEKDGGSNHSIDWFISSLNNKNRLLQFGHIS